MTEPGSGYSGVFAFPFRVNAKERLSDFIIEQKTHQYRVHAPFLMRTNGSPVTNDVPARFWSNFRWHPSVSSEKRRLMGEIGLSFGGPMYDGVRIDVWGSQAQSHLLPLFRRAMRWLRWDSGQPWIGDVDRHFEHTLKRVFPINDTGAAMAEVSPLGEVFLIVTIRLVTDNMWKIAFQRAAAGQEVPFYWNIFYDSLNARAVGEHERAIMNLAMALESARDLNFSRIHPAKVTANVGPKLKDPFAKTTDLLRHISTDSRTVFGRDFSEEQPSHWPHLVRLYRVRHKVAHGGRAAFVDEGITRTITMEDYDAWQEAARDAIVWMEAVVRKLSGSTSLP